MKASDEIREAFAPKGEIRVALNFGNRILVGRGTDGRPHGISVDLARALAEQLGVKLRFVEFERAIDVSSAATDDLWDVCFLAVDPKRAETIDFTHPYVQIEGRYLAAPGCTAASSEDLLDSGAKVGTVSGSAYTLTLLRKPGAENLVEYPDIFAALAALDAGEVAAIAGIGDVMAAEAALRPGARTLSPPFMVIRQAMATVKGHEIAADFLRKFVTNMAREGKVGEILERHGVSRDFAIVS